MSARIFVHPACIHVPARAKALASGLADLGYAMDTFAVYDPPSVRRSNVHELVRDIGSLPNGRVYERMDGVQFVQHTTSDSGPAVA